MHDNWDTEITQCETKKNCVAKISCIILVQQKKVQSLEIYNLCPLISCITLIHQKFSEGERTITKYMWEIYLISWENAWSPLSKYILRIDYISGKLLIIEEKTMDRERFLATMTTTKRGLMVIGGKNSATTAILRWVFTHLSAMRSNTLRLIKFMSTLRNRDFKAKFILFKAIMFYDSLRRLNLILVLNI